MLLCPTFELLGPQGSWAGEPQESPLIASGVSSGAEGQCGHMTEEGAFRGLHEDHSGPWIRVVCEEHVASETDPAGESPHDRPRSFLLQLRLWVLVGAGL